MSDTLARLQSEIRDREANTEFYDPDVTDMLKEVAAEIKRLREILTAIAEGYPVHGESDRYVIVENPRFRPDDGSSPNLVWEKKYA